ncbi:MAG: SLATT domain-containing protein [Nitrospirales bacterium]
MALSDNIWWTRKARIQTEKRLLSSSFQAQILLLWYSFCSAVAAIYYLKFNTQSEYAGVAWVVFSVLVLCISGFINGLGYKERALLIKNCYEALNSLYQQTKRNQNDTISMGKEYEKILSVCENHADIDYHLALCDTYLSHNNPNDSSSRLDRKPTKYIWTLVVVYHIKKRLLLGGLYLLPIVLFCLMEFSNVSQGKI